MVRQYIYWKVVKEAIWLKSRCLHLQS